MFDLRKIHVRGAPRDLGRGQGEALREPIRAFIEQRLTALRAYLEERGEARRFDEFIATAHACLGVAERYDADGSAEHAGIAEAAGVDAVLLYGATNMTDIRDVLVLPTLPDREGCTSVLVPKAHSKTDDLICGQTWDLNPTDLDFVVAVERTPLAGPKTWSITCTGALSLMGMNADGLALGTTNIKTRASRPGVGYLSILHRALREPSVARARDVVVGAPRAAAHTYWLADADSATELECDPETVSERALTDAPVVQTNHCQAPALKAREGEVASESSQQRLERARRVLASREHDVETLQALFADRSAGVNSINRYAEDAQGTTTNACLICIPARRELFACRGPADRGSWTRLEF